MPKAKKKIEDFSPEMQRLLRLRDSQGEKEEWTVSTTEPSDPFSASLNSDEQNKILEQLHHIELSDNRSDNTVILDKLLKDMNKLQRESLILYHTIINDPNDEKSNDLKKEYLLNTSNIKKINQFILNNILNKKYYIYDMKKGIKKYKLISGKYEDNVKVDMVAAKDEYSFF